MTTKATHYRRSNVLTILFAVSGGTIIVLALIADRLGYGDSGSFGIGQSLLVLTGLIVLLIGLLGKRFLKFYRDVATILLNTVILLAFLELGAIIIGRSYFQVKHTGIQDLPYYAAQDWTKLYWQEANLTQSYRYQPYVVWRHLPFSGQTISFNEEGIRQTPGAECNQNAYKVFTFGGSTMLGWGSPDWATIPAYLQAGLETLSEEPVCVVNFGEDGYVSTQNLIELMVQLQSGNIPNLVIFYDGVNEVIAAHESGQAGSHVTLTKIAARFEEREHPIITWGKSTRMYTLIDRWLYNLEQKGEGNNSLEVLHKSEESDSDHLADSVSQIYLSNYKIVGALAREYDFDYFFFLQPHLAVGNKVLTSEEQIMRSRMDPALIELAKTTYSNIAPVISEYEHLKYLGDIFDQEKNQIWIDEVGHITPEGNRLVAQEILTVFQRQVAKK